MQRFGHAYFKELCFQFLFAMLSTPSDFVIIIRVGNLRVLSQDAGVVLFGKPTLNNHKKGTLQTDTP